VISYYIVTDYAVNGSADSCHGSCYPMGWRIGTVDPATQWASLIGLLPNGLADGTVDPATRRNRLANTVGTVDPATQWARDRCCESFYLMGWQIVPWILLPNGLADRCLGS
jgi:hypothetical protein